MLVPIEARDSKAQATASSTQYLTEALRLWKNLQKTPEGIPWTQSYNTQFKLRQMLAKCELYGVGIGDCPPPGQTKQTWLTWANACPAPQGEGLLHLLTRLVAQRGVTVLNGGVLPNARSTHKKPSHDAQIKAMNTKFSGGGCQGLMIGSNEKTGLPEPTTRHDLLVDHILRS